MINKNKIINDPVYGFITLPSDLIYEIIAHPYFQRLRRIKQLGLTSFVYPGALHTRFHHALGAMHLMRQALLSLRSKRVEISNDEFQACLIAILMHDIGHGPFSHTLEFDLLEDINHEDISVLFFQELNRQFDGQLTLAQEIFTDQYERRFFHQLVSSQLDVDRLDYLKRDSFFTGVSEGSIGSERIINMLQVIDDQIVVEEKGIYSIEHFLSARRIMYWQVYLHKTSVSAEEMLIGLIRRAKYLTQKGLDVPATPALRHFLEKNMKLNDFHSDSSILELFSLLDDSDVWGSMKFWREHEDFVLSTLSKDLLDRRIFKIHLSNEKTEKEFMQTVKSKIKEKYRLSSNELTYFASHGKLSNSAYMPKDQKILVLTKHGEILDIEQAADLPNIKAMSKNVVKHFFCYKRMV